MSEVGHFFGFHAKGLVDVLVNKPLRDSVYRSPTERRTPSFTRRSTSSISTDCGRFALRLQRPQSFLSTLACSDISRCTVSTEIFSMTILRRFRHVTVVDESQGSCSSLETQKGRALGARPQPLRGAITKNATSVACIHLSSPRGHITFQWR